MCRLIFLVTLVVSLAVAQNERTARVVGGRSVCVGEIPYQVSLRAFGSPIHFCGGALISNRWVVTAATCVYGHARNSIDAVVGIISLYATGVGRRSSDIIVHHQFNPDVIDHNIALILVASPFPLNDNIRPIRVSSIIIRNEVPARISGFGAISINAGVNSDRLQLLYLTTATQIDCSQAYPNINFDTNICTSNGFGEGMCTSDMGGPLISNSELIGIASWHNPCALGDMDIFVRISAYRLWIASIAGV